MSADPLTILDVRIDNVTLQEALDRSADFLAEPRLHHVVTPGPEFLLEASANPPFKKILNQSDLAVPDGFGLHLAARLTQQRLRQRVAGVDYVLGLLQLAERLGKSVFLFGAQPGVADAAAQKLKQDFPTLNIAGVETDRRGWWKHGDHRIIEKIHRTKPDILLVALGAPKQELWIEQHHQALHDVRIAVGVGRTFDYLAGTIKRPPAFIRHSGFEWLYTWMFASRFHHSQQRRQRVTNATWHFLRTVLHHRHE